MPILNQNLTIDVTPEKFLQACSIAELIEVDILITSHRYVQKMKSKNQEEDLKDTTFLIEQRPKNKVAVDINDRKCRQCGCTQKNCEACIEKTGHPCYWIEPDLCSACVKEDEETKDKS